MYAARHRGAPTSTGAPVNGWIARPESAREVQNLNLPTSRNNVVRKQRRRRNYVRNQHTDRLPGQDDFTSRTGPHTNPGRNPDARACSAPRNCSSVSRNTRLSAHPCNGGRVRRVTGWNEDVRRPGSRNGNAWLPFRDWFAQQPRQEYAPRFDLWIQGHGLQQYGVQW